MAQKSQRLKRDSKSIYVTIEVGLDSRVLVSPLDSGLLSLQ